MFLRRFEVQLILIVSRCHQIINVKTANHIKQNPITEDERLSFLGERRRNYHDWTHNGRARMANSRHRLRVR